MIRVLIVDDQSLVRQGYRALLAKADDIQVVDEARDGVEALEPVHRLNPDVVLMDIQMPRLDGLQATRLLRAQDRCTRMLMVSMRMDAEVLQRAMANGAWGLVAKADVYPELPQAIRTVSQCRRYFSASVSKLLSELHSSTYHSFLEIQSDARASGC